MRKIFILIIIFSSLAFCQNIKQNQIKDLDDTLNTRIKYGDSTSVYFTKFQGDTLKTDVTQNAADIDTLQTIYDRPEKYGAAGDSTTNDVAALTALLASGADRVILTRRYIVSTPITLVSNIIIEMQGNASISTIDYADIFRQADSVSNVKFINCVFYSAYGNDEDGFLGSAYNSNTYGSSNIIFENCRFYGLRSAINITKNKNLSIWNCKFYGNSRVAIYVTNSTNFTAGNNYVDGRRTGHGDEAFTNVGIWAMDNVNTTLFNNTVEYTLNEGIIARDKGQRLTINTVRYSGTVSGTSSYGIIAEGKGTEGANETLIYGNTTDSCWGGISARYDPANPEYSPVSVIIEKNIVKKSWGGNGIEVNQGADDALIAKNIIVKTNEIYNTYSNAISIANTQWFTVENNIIDSARVGIFSFGNSTKWGKIESNNIKNTTEYGIANEADSIDFVTNKVYNVNYDGTGSENIGVRLSSASSGCNVTLNNVDGGANGTMAYGIYSNTGQNTIINNFVYRYTTAAVSYNGTQNDTTFNDFRWIGNKKVSTGTAAPTVGTWAQGDMVLNNTGQPFAWVCVTAGTPGTWKAIPDLSYGHIAFIDSSITHSLAFDTWTGLSSYGSKIQVNTTNASDGITVNSGYYLVTGSVTMEVDSGVTYEIAVPNPHNQAVVSSNKYQTTANNQVITMQITCMVDVVSDGLKLRLRFRNKTNGDDPVVYSSNLVVKKLNN
jgi:hypothetical protein